MTLGKVRPGDVLAGLGGLALLVLVFVPWYEFLEGVYTGTRTIAPGDEVQSAWESLTVLRFFLLFCGLLGVTQLATTAFERTSAWPVAATVFSAAIATPVALWTFVRVLITPPGPNFAADLRWGAWVGLLCVLAVTAGAWWSMRDEVRP